jgi:hypothetical protein
MPLPQQVVEQLSRDSSAKTPGWSSGIILFSIAIFGVVALIYLGLTFGYEPYLNGQITSAQSQTTKLGAQVSSADEAQLVTYYSQIANVQKLITSHVLFSQFLTWLGANTEANVYYTNFTFASGNQVTLAALAKTPADVVAQIGVFESSPEVQGVSVSNISSAQSGGWSFNVVLTMNPSIFSWQSGTPTATTTTP